MIDHFLQSQEWRDLLTKQGNETITLFVDEHGDEVYGVIKKMRFGFTHLYIPRIDMTPEHYEHVLGVAQQHAVDFIRWEPITMHFLPLAFQKVGDYQPATTLIIDLAKSTEELHAQLHPKTRYNISLAQRKGVTTRIGNLDEFDLFWNLIHNTYSRKEITSLGYDHYKSIIRNHAGAYLVFAELDGKVITANLYIRHGNTVTYLHGGSDNEYKQFMAPQLLQWSEIERSQRDGFAFYDMWGIAPDDDPSHPWAGITRFKKGFGGEVVSFPGTYEMGMTWKYRIYKLLTKLR